MRTLWQLCLLSLGPLLLVQCSAVTLPEPGETFSDLLSSGQPGPEMVVLPVGESEAAGRRRAGCRSSGFESPERSAVEAI